MSDIRVAGRRLLMSLCLLFGVAVIARAEEEYPGFNPGSFSGYCNSGTCCPVFGSQGYTGCADSCGEGDVAQGYYITYGDLWCTGYTTC